MENRLLSLPGSDDSGPLQVQAMSRALCEIRKAQRKLSASSCGAGTAEWLNTLEDFAYGVVRALEAEGRLLSPEMGGVPNE